MDLFQAMSVYVKVVESGSMTAAAHACGISTTMVGNHLRALEQRLGVSLLKRTTRKQSLTEFGGIYYQRCLEVLGLVAAAVQGMDLTWMFALSPPCPAGWRAEEGRVHRHGWPLAPRTSQRGCASCL